MPKFKNRWRVSEKKKSEISPPQPACCHQFWDGEFITSYASSFFNFAELIGPDTAGKANVFRDARHVRRQNTMPPTFRHRYYHCRLHAWACTRPRACGRSRARLTSRGSDLVKDALLSASESPWTETSDWEEDPIGKNTAAFVVFVNANTFARAKFQILKFCNDDASKWQRSGKKYLHLYIKCIYVQRY